MVSGDIFGSIRIPSYLFVLCIAGAGAPAEKDYAPGYDSGAIENRRGGSPCEEGPSGVKRGAELRTTDEKTLREADCLPEGGKRVGFPLAYHLPKYGAPGSPMSIRCTFPAPSISIMA
jgi:hypothetical protein